MCFDWITYTDSISVTSSPPNLRVLLKRVLWKVKSEVLYSRMLIRNSDTLIQGLALLDLAY